MSSECLRKGSVVELERGRLVGGEEVRETDCVRSSKSLLCVGSFSNSNEQQGVNLSDLWLHGTEVTSGSLAGRPCCI